MPKELQSTQESDYFKNWNLWSVDPYKPGNWTRQKRGVVTFAEGQDLYFDYNGKQVASANKADPTKTMQVVTLSGMFPTIKQKYNLASDAIDFHYYEGYIYSLMTQMEGTRVHGTTAYPTNAYLYYNSATGSLQPSLANFAMLGGFVRNPIDKDSKDIIAFVANPTAGADFIAMCLCWFEDSSYETSGYLFEEEGHMYPILVNSEADIADGEIGNLPASCTMISNELQKGQTNCVETAHGYVMYTIDRFRSLPHNYLENIQNIQVTIDRPAVEHTMTKSGSTSLPVSFSSEKADFINRTRR